MKGGVTELSYKEFDEKVLSPTAGLVVVDFWAPWCGPCRQLAPIIEEISSEMTHVKFYKVNLDEEGNDIFATKYHITAIPTVLFFKNGTIVDRILGLTSKNEIIKRIKEIETR
jgi:thioredoxin 1